MARVLLLFYSSLLLFAFSCNKPNAPDCLRKGGEDDTIKRMFANDISRLVLHDYLQIELIPSTENYIEIHGPKNLIESVSTEEIEQGAIEIRLDVGCNFVRSYKRKISVKIYMDIVEIENYSSGDITSSSTITQSYFQLDCHDSSGAISLDLDCDSVRISIHNGVSDVVAKGTANKVYLYSLGTNVLDASQLQSHFTFINSGSINSIFAVANNYLFAAINSSGSIYYSGNPSAIDLYRIGTGELIHH